MLCSLLLWLSLTVVEAAWTVTTLNLEPNIPPPSALATASRTAVLTAIGSTASTVGLPLLTDPLNTTAPPDYRTTRFVRNTSNPFSSFYGFTGVAMGGNGGDSGKNVTLIAPRVVIGEVHTGAHSESSFDFVHRDNTMWVPNVVDYEVMTGWDVDAMLILLDEDAPAGIEVPYTMTVALGDLCTDWMPMLMKHARQQVYEGANLTPPYQQFSLEVAKRTGVGQQWFVPSIGNRFRYFGEADVSSWLNGVPATYSLGIYAGDSGSGTFLVVDTSLVFTGFTGGAGWGEHVNCTPTIINSYIQTLYTRNSLTFIEATDGVQPFDETAWLP